MNHSFHIEVVDLHWLEGCKPETDLCSHGTVRVRVGDREVVTPEDGEFTLSAAALHLLRTLGRDHTEVAPLSEVSDHLLPHCGNPMIDATPAEDVLLFGCDKGIDWWVQHSEGSVHLSGLRGVPPLKPDRPFEVTISGEEYEAVVRAFATEVWQHFTASDKHIDDEFERNGLRAFVAEYQRRLGSKP